MSFLKKTKANTTITNTTSFMQALKTLKEFLSIGDDAQSFYEGNEVLDAQDFENITNVDDVAQKLDNYFESVLASDSKRKIKRKLKKRLFSKKVTYTVSINTENGMKVAKLKIDYKYRNNQLQQINFSISAKNNTRNKKSATSNSKINVRPVKESSKRKNSVQKEIEL